MITFFVPGRPQGQGSKTKTRWGALREDNKELGPWRERVALVAYAALEGSEYDDDDEPGIISGPIAVGLEFVLYRPKGAPKGRTQPATKKPDIDKLERGVLDALTHVIWTDDAQVVTVLKHKRVAELNESPGVHVWIEAIHD